MKRLYYFPPASKGGYTNPYSINYKAAMGKYYKVKDASNNPSFMLTLSFLRFSFTADIYIINWLENVSFLKYNWLQYLLARIGLCIIKLRKKDIIWMFHNIHPHQGENKATKKIQQLLFKQAKWIISHSQEAEKYANSKAEGKVIYIPHPAKIIKTKDYMGYVKKCDVLIWGAILPYKGIKEFISNEDARQSKLIINIIGICKNEYLRKEIESYCNENITFENRRIDFNELKAAITQSKYVLFPYIGNCVSSSGALIDTIVLGGTPIGPKVGAFLDLQDEGVCFTYESYKELISLLKSDNVINPDCRKNFIKNNTWGNFAKHLHQLIEK